MLLAQTALRFGVPASHPELLRKGSVTGSISFNGIAPDESIYGLGEHKNRRVEQGNGTGWAAAAAAAALCDTRHTRLCPRWGVWLFVVCV